MLTATDLQRMDGRELANVIRNGHAIEPSRVANKEFRGVSLGLPSFVERLTWKTFKKVFCQDDASGPLRGWNVRVRQTGLGAPFVAREKRGVRETFGHYAVATTPSGLLLDYGRFAKTLDPLRFVRDPVVAVNAGDATLLLGTTYLSFPFGRVRTPSFFSLELDGDLRERVATPRA